jgi:hypothetical protein
MVGGTWEKQSKAQAGLRELCDWFLARATSVRRSRYNDLARRNETLGPRLRGDDGVAELRVGAVQSGPSRAARTSSVAGAATRSPATYFDFIRLGR